VKNCKFLNGLYPFLILFITVSIALIIASILGILGWILGNKQKQSKEKLNPFECGFDNSPNYRFPLSLRFFIITVLFLLFDIEIVLLLPLPISSCIIIYNSLLILVIIFMLLLIIGLYFEWQQGSLDWNW
jgi:NADH-ubiquinone oxidoreductase chain 3